MDVMTATNTSVSYSIAPLGDGVSLEFSLVGSGGPTLAEYDEAVQAFADVLIAAHSTLNPTVFRTIHISDDEGQSPWYP